MGKGIILREMKYLFLMEEQIGIQFHTVYSIL